jgi:hypothetical protein
VTNPFLIHAGLMILAWLVLLPSGAMVARFCKVTVHQDWPRVLDNQLWWWLHRILQYAGVACALAAFLVAYRTTGGVNLGLLHTQLGLVVLAIAIGQIISTWFRGSKGGLTSTGADEKRPETWRGDHYDMTPRRRIFEAWHKAFGWLSLALIAIALGLRLLGWPAELCAVAALVTLLQAGAFVVLARHSRRISTYQALWGPNPTHPGNRARRWYVLAGWLANATLGACPARPVLDCAR